jgi:pimeloyl-ACP methyl ester carboxylesterase
MWRPVMAGFASASRTCVYDRPGLGRSPSRRGPTLVDAGLHARELHALLAAARITTPLVLVGHSYGALIVRAYARAYPGQVAGMLLLDGVYPGIQRNYWAPYRGNWIEGHTIVDLAASQVATGTGPSLGHRPLVVITAGNPEPGAPEWVVELWDHEQDVAATLSTNVIHVVAIRSGHVIQSGDPAAVVEGVRELVVAVRTGRVLPRCAAAWVADGARCLS